ncbi:diguanylate cyclase, partial [bacterium]|nr:diguanylate cyclase [bacterium]
TVMQSVVKKGFAARYGGEELVLVLPGASLREAAQQAEKARARLADSSIPVPERELSFQMTASFGVSESGRHGDSPLKLITAADEALYAAKEKGRNAVYLAGKPPACFSSPRKLNISTESTKQGSNEAGTKLVEHPPKKRDEERRKPKSPPLPNISKKPESKRVISNTSRLRERLASVKAVGAYNLTRNDRLPFSRLCPSPYAVDFKGEELFVIDFHRSQVHSLSSRQLKQVLLGRGQRLAIKTISGSLRGPVAVTRDDLGYLCVLDSQNHEVRKFSNDGTPGRIYGGIGNGRGELSRPQDVVHDGEKLIIADMDNRRIQAYGFSKRVEFEVGLQSHSGGVMPKPEKLALATDGRIYVLDTANSRIVVYSNAGEYQSELTDYGSRLGQLRSPVDLTVTDEGVLVVAEGGDNNRLQFFDLDLNSLGKLELGAVLFNKHRLSPLAPTRRNEPNVQSLRPGSLAGNTLNELYLIDQNTSSIFLLEI